MRSGVDAPRVTFEHAGPGEITDPSDAVATFRNSDSGFGHALEPDGRTPASQRAAVAMALTSRCLTPRTAEGAGTVKGS
jgi:hypothetical protein